MRRFSSRLAVLGGAIALAAGVAQATEVFRAHYEISVASQGKDNTVRSTFEARPGEPFTLDLPPNVVAMSVRRLGVENYELQVTVKPARDRQGPVLFSHTYQGVLGRPLELRNAADAVKVDGAISVVVLNR
jgi:hypothetical protein